VQVAALSWLVAAALVALERAGEGPAGDRMTCCDDECSPMPLRCPAAGATQAARCDRRVQSSAGLLAPAQAVQARLALAADLGATGGQGAPGANDASARLIASVTLAPRAPPSASS
jgi:hypothetical protein